MSLSAGFQNDVPEVRNAAEHISLNLAGPCVLKGKDASLPVPGEGDGGKVLSAKEDGSGYELRSTAGFRLGSKLIDYSNGGIWDGYPAYGLNFFAYKYETDGENTVRTLPENCIILSVDVVAEDDSTYPLMPSSDTYVQNLFVAQSPIEFDCSGDETLMIAVISQNPADIVFFNTDYTSWKGFRVNYLCFTEGE